MSGLIWVETVCKRYQQTTVAAKDLIGLCYVKANVRRYFQRSIIQYIHAKQFPQEN